MSEAGPWLLALISPAFTIVGVVIGAWMTSRRERNKLQIENEEQLRGRRREAYAEFYAIVFGTATAVMEEYEAGVLKDLPTEHVHDSLRLRAIIGLLGPDEVTRKVDGVLATLNGLYDAAADPSEHASVPLIAIEVRRDVDQVLGVMHQALYETIAPPVRGLRRVGRPA